MVASSATIEVVLVRLDGLTPAARRRSSHDALGVLLARRMNVAPAAVDVQVDRRGKPFVVEGPAFNMSDSGEYAAYAFAAGGHVGVDIERITTVEDALAIAADHFPADAARLAALDGAELMIEFHRAWTRFEATAKATGLGIADPVIIPPGWEVRNFAAIDGYAAAVAHSTSDFGLEVSFLSLPDLVG